MAKFFDGYKKALERETLQFLFLIGKSNSKLLMQKYKKKNLGEYVRLACIAKAFGYNRVLIKIVATVEKDMDEFLKGLDSLNGNFALFESWIINFIDGIKNVDAQKLARDYWEEVKAELDKENFNIRQFN